MRRRLLRVATSLWIIVIVAMGLRVLYAWHEVQQVVPRELLTAHFQQETGNIAYSLAVGKGFSSPYGQETGPTAWLTPIYPLLVAGIFRVFGIETVHAFYASVFINMLFSAVTCVPIFLAGKRIAGAGVGIGAAWAWALFPNAIMLPYQWIWDTSFSALMVATLLWATLMVAESERWRDWCGYGLLWGFALMVDPAPGSVLPFWLAWLAYRGRDQTASRSVKGLGEGLGRVAFSAAIAILCCLPWTIRNYRVFHEFVPLRSNLGLELYVGNNENSDDVHPRVWPFLITREREIFRFYRMGEMPFMHEEMHKALHFMYSHPHVEVYLLRDRMVGFWMGTAAPYRDFLGTDSVLLRLVEVCSLVLLLGTLGGIVVLYFRHNAFALPLTAAVVVFPLLYYATHSSLRYRHALDPILVLLTTIAVALPLQMIANRCER